MTTYEEKGSQQSIYVVLAPTLLQDLGQQARRLSCHTLCGWQYNFLRLISPTHYPCKCLTQLLHTPGRKEKTHDTSYNCLNVWSLFPNFAALPFHLVSNNKNYSIFYRDVGQLMRWCFVHSIVFQTMLRCYQPGYCFQSQKGKTEDKSSMIWRSKAERTTQKFERPHDVKT